MRKLFITATVVALAIVVLSVSALAATGSFTLTSESSLAGIHLQKGKYKIKIDGDQATIMQNGKVIGTARVEVRKTKVRNPGSVLRAADGRVLEIRLKNQVVTIVR